LLASHPLHHLPQSIREYPDLPHSHRAPPHPPSGASPVINIDSNSNSNSIDINLTHTMAASSSSSQPLAVESRETKRIPLLPLPWGRDALEPFISKTQIDTHYDGHHAKYVKDLNEAGEKEPELGILGHSLETLIRTLKGGKPLNSATQTWNHSFYWRSMAPSTKGGGGHPSGALAELMNESFGSFDKFKEEFSARATAHFASGWIWLVLGEDNKLHIVETHDGGNVIREKLGKPLLAFDVWEHAYYIDQRNVRNKYIENWWHVVNWSFASECLNAKCIAQGGPCEATESAAFPLS